MGTERNRLDSMACSLGPLFRPIRISAIAKVVPREKKESPESNIHRYGMDWGKKFCKNGIPMFPRFSPAPLMVYIPFRSGAFLAEAAQAAVSIRTLTSRPSTKDTIYQKSTEAALKLLTSMAGRVRLKIRFANTFLSSV